MSLLGRVVGIDPSGRRLALVVRGTGVSRAMPPVVVPLRAEREPARLEEAESALRDYVARHGLAGSAARLCVPAAHVFTARIAFPPLRDRDLRPALELELERLFPFPSSRLLFGWRRLGKSSGGKTVPLVVAAATAEYVERWQDIASRAGLTLTLAVPSAWALSRAIAEIGGVEPDGLIALLRDAGGDTECALISGREPFFSAVRPASAGTGVEEGFQALALGLSDVPAGVPDGAGAILVAPARWSGACMNAEAAPGVPFRAASDFPSRAARTLFGTGRPEGKDAAFDLLGAFGAAANGAGIDWLDRTGEGTGSRAARWIAAGTGVLALLLAVAWPLLVDWKTRAEGARLDREIAFLRPAVAQVEAAVAELEDLDARIAVLRDAGEGRGEMLLILRELTDRLPQRTWITGLRIENRKVEIDGLAAAANEIFPLLSRDGRFQKVEFASPITRQPDNTERFQIRAEYSPPSNPDGGAQ